MTFPGFPQAGGFAPQQPAPQAFGGFPQQPQAPAGFGGFPQQPQAPAAAPQRFSDPNSFLMGGGIPAAAFPQLGATVTGVVEDLEVQQQRDLDTGAPLVWDDGRPREQLVVTLATDERDPANPLDDGRRKLYCKGGSMPQAIAKACRAAGHPEGLEIGGRLAVQYVGDGEARKRGYNPPKLYAAQYQAPDPNAGANSVLMGGGLEQAPAQQQAPAGFGQAPQQAYATGGYVGPGAAGVQQPYPVPQTMQQQAPQTAPGVTIAGGMDFGQMLGQMQQPAAPAAPQAPAGVAIPDELPANVKAALAVLPPEQVAAALAQMGIGQAPAA